MWLSDATSASRKLDDSECWCHSWFFSPSTAVGRDSSGVCSRAFNANVGFCYPLTVCRIMGHQTWSRVGLVPWPRQDHLSKQLVPSLFKLLPLLIAGMATRNGSFIYATVNLLRQFQNVKIKHGEANASANWLVKNGIHQSLGFNVFSPFFFWTFSFYVSGFNWL